MNRTPSFARTTVAFAALVCLLPGLALAQDVEPYLEKMLAMYNSPFTADFTMDMSMNQGGMSMSMKGTGDMTWADESHMLLNVAMTMAMPGSDQTMTMNMKTVSDGTHTWTEMDNPMMGKQVMKINLEQAQKMAEEQGMTNNAGMSPFEQLRTLQQFFDFSVADKSGGKVKLMGKLRDDAPAQMQEAGPMVEGMVVVLDEASGIIDRFEMGPAGSPAMVMTLSNYKKVSKSDVPASMFEYTVPPGVTPMDPLAMQP